MGENKGNNNKFDRITQVIGKKVGNSVFYTQNGQENTQQLLSVNLQKELVNTFDILEAFRKNKTTTGQTVAKLKNAQDVFNHITEANKPFEKGDRIEATTSERKTSFLSKAYEIILAGLGKLLDALTNFKLTKGEKTKFGDLDKESQRSIQKVIKELKSSLHLFSEKGAYNFRGAEQKHPNNFDTGAGIFKKKGEWKKEENYPTKANTNEKSSKLFAPAVLEVREKSAQEGKKR